MMSCRKFFPRNLRLQLIRQRMANITDFDAVLRVKLLFEGEDHDHLADIFPDLLRASGAPGPYLRADKVEHRNSQAVQLACQTQIKVGEVYQDGRVGLAPRRFRYQMLEAPADSRQM